ncbi:MAG: hypothetical protein QXG39_05310 [Candidatus Aenigmatarchaeota archaeon]
MGVTINDLFPIGLCIATQELLDSKRFKNNFCDFLILKHRDEITDKVIEVKRKLNSSSLEKNFLEGYKSVILSNIDKIISFVVTRYSNLDSKLVEKVVEDAKNIMKKVLEANSFDKLAELEPEFKSKITLQVYKLFTTSLR